MTTIWHRLLAVMIILAAGYAVARTGGASAVKRLSRGRTDLWSRRPSKLA
jgi:hypothetical protein